MLRGLRQRFVLVIGLPGQQHPKRVDAERRTERDVQQRDETHDQRDRTCPILALQQTPTREETCRGFCQQQPSDDSEQGPQPDRDFGRWATIENMKRVAEDDLRDNDQGHSGNHVQRRVRHPENAHQPDMVANPAAPKLDESKYGFAAASAAWLSRLQLRTTLIAKHSFSSRAARIVLGWWYGCKHAVVPRQFSVPSCQFSVNSQRIVIRLRTGN